MLMLTRREKQKVILTVGEEQIEIVVGKIDHGEVRLGFAASDKVKIIREEIIGKPMRTKRDSNIIYKRRKHLMQE